MIDFHIMSLGAESFAINDYMVEGKKIQSLTKKLKFQNLSNPFKSLD